MTSVSCVSVTKWWMCIMLDVLFLTVHVCALENLALRKPFWEDQEWKDPKIGWRGGNAVDGLYTDRSANGGQCVITENKAQTATWRVDLGGVVSISHIDIYYRTGNKGCSQVGVYGLDCNKPCPANCQEKRCDVNMGHCLGCLSGYQGPTCSQVCKQGFFGDECSRRCGNCRNKQTCHHINGSCLNGCDEGVKGWNCTTECDPGFYGKHCIHSCSENCYVNGSCDRFYGECEGGCKPGWTGITCKQISTASEESQVGAIVGGIFAVIVVILIAIAVVILYKRLNPRISRQQTAGNKRTDSSNNQTNEDSEYYTELQVSNEACQYEVLKTCLK
ncbi:uncharacterized protein LOC111116527 isoform X3 [Crassostrea virginica]